MVSARAENIPTSPDSLLFNLAADWIMRDLANGLEDPRFPKKLHEALWWGNMRWIIIIALGATGAAAAAQNYFSKEDRSNVLPLPEPKSSPIPTEKPTNRASLATPYPTTTELPPTPRPTRTLYPTDIFTSTPVDTATSIPPTKTKPSVATKLPTEIPSSPTPQPPTEIPPPVDEWTQDPYGPPGDLYTKPSSLIHPLCLEKWQEILSLNRINNFSSSPTSEIIAMDPNHPLTKFTYACETYEGKIALRVYGP